MTVFSAIAFSITFMFLPFVFTNDVNWIKYLYQEFVTMTIYKVIVPILSLWSKKDLPFIFTNLIMRSEVNVAFASPLHIFFTFGIFWFL